MKFWKILSSLIEETLPDWRDKFLSYKDLKKHLKQSCPKEGDDGSQKLAKRPKLADNSSNRTDNVDPAVSYSSVDGGEVPALSSKDEVEYFVQLLEDEIEKFNAFVMEKEEEYVIKWKELQDMVVKSSDSSEDLMKVGREIVDMHGEMILLENYSALNYTGLVKILKKYEKQSGVLIRLPFIQKVLQEPFYSNDMLYKLIKECEAMLERLFTENEQWHFSKSKPPSASSLAAFGESSNHPIVTETTELKERMPKLPNELEDIKKAENMYTRLTLSALRALREVRGGSSTVNVFSLPPLPSTSPEEDPVWKNACVVEQAAK
ncbi:hypothetical protein V2J09_009331 [Rumex salicifolius]